MGINQSSPTCEANQCLNQVIGTNVDGASNGFAQYLRCVENYSSAQRETITLEPINTYFSTVIPTASNTDVVVEISTGVSTVYLTSTSYSQVVETVTDYTTTSVLTASTTVTATSLPALTIKKHKKRGSRCKPSSIPLSSISSSATPSSIVASSIGISSIIPSSTAPSSIGSSSIALSSVVTSSIGSPSVVPSSIVPSSAIVSSIAPSSIVPSSAVPSSVPISTTTTPPQGPVSVAPGCPNVEAYSSACSCIYAASDATQTFTSQRPDTTVLVTETVTAIPSTSTDLTINTVTVTVPEGAMTTMTSTISTGTVTTTTYTCTSTVLPTETSEIFVAGGTWDGRVLVAASAVQAGTPGTGAEIVVARAGGQPYLASNPASKLWITYQANLGRTVFSAVTDPGTLYYAVVCSTSDANKLSCRAGSLDVDTFMTVSTNPQIYMANAAYIDTHPAFTVVGLNLPNTC